MLFFGIFNSLVTALVTALYRIIVGVYPHNVWKKLNQYDVYVVFDRYYDVSFKSRTTTARENGVTRQHLYHQFTTTTTTCSLQCQREQSTSYACVVTGSNPTYYTILKLWMERVQLE